MPSSYLSPGTTEKLRRKWGYVPYDDEDPNFEAFQAKNLFGPPEEVRDADGLRFFEYDWRGLVTLASWTMQQFGFSFLLGWLAKSLIVRSGGLRLYVKLRPFFLGLVLGDVIIATVMTVVGFVTGVGYFVMPD